jgi:hypothetical protein
MNGRRILLVIMAVCFVVVPQKVLAQQKIPVVVIHDGNDSVGERLVYQVKEAVRRSAGFRLVQENEPGYRMRLITRDLNQITYKNSPVGIATIYAVTITIKPPGQPEVFLVSDMANCTTNRINEVAEILVRELDKVGGMLKPGFFNPGGLIIIAPPSEARGRSGGVP